MAIEGINLGMKSLESIRGIGSGIGENQPVKTKGGSFSEIFTEAIKDVDKMQTDADKKIEGLVLGKEGVSTHDAMIALEKADVAFQLMNAIRSKIVRAYEEVMRTQV
jgi:flagellar hook-basal body complex protein FliE